MSANENLDSTVRKRVTIIIVLLLAVAGVLWVKNQEKAKNGTAAPCCPANGGSADASGVCAVVAPAGGAADTAKPVASAGASQADSAKAKALPRLVDLGADKCVPCKMMAPILEELRKEQAGKLEVEFIDVWKNPEEGKAYAIRIIPTQIFFDAEGKELFRHEGFISKEDIIAKWKEFGVGLEKKAGDE